MNKEIEEKIDRLLDKYIGKVYKDWNEVVKAKDEFRSALSSMFKPQVMDLDKILPTKEYPECCVGGHNKDNCPQCARAYYYQEGIDDCRKALANMPKCMTKEEVEKVIFALKKARVFIEYARYELDDGKATIGSQFPHKEDADIETTRLKEAIDLASKLIGKE
jgi:hypothetical protein